MSEDVSEYVGAILSRVQGPENGDLPHEVFRWLLGVRCGPSDRERMMELYAKAYEAALTETEDAELKAYGEIGRLLEILRDKARASMRSRAAEGIQEEPPVYGDIIVADPPPARIRQSAVTVGQILTWLAEGQTEEAILNGHSELQRADIRASLAFAAAREKSADKPTGPTQRTFSERWKGRFKLKDPDPDDPRLTHLLERYERYRS
jgi:hypothetical protein